MATPHPPQGKPRPRHRMVDRVAEILDLAARRPHGATLTEMARVLEAPLSSIQGLTNGLVATGFLEERDRLYTLGPAPHFLTRLAGTPASDVVTHADLEEIHDRTGLTTVLAVLVGADLYYVDHASTSPAYAYLAENYVKRSVLRCSSGWVLLAGMERRDLWSRLSAARPEEEPLVERLLADLPTIQETGLVITPDVSEVEIEGIATAVTVDGRTVAAVACIGDHGEINERADEIVGVLREARGRWAARG